MTLGILTKQDLQLFKAELIAEIKKAVKTNETSTSKNWLKSKEVTKLLKITPGTLQNYRKKGMISYTKIGGTYFYQTTTIEKLLTTKPQSNNNSNNKKQ